MAKVRASKGLIVPPQKSPVPDAKARELWLAKAKASFVASPANRVIYGLILDKLWPKDHGIPGAVVSESEIHELVNSHRTLIGKDPYKDPFRRMRELQGDEGFTCIIKEGTKYQLKSLEIGPKREPRSKPKKKLWEQIKKKAGHRCAHCSQQEPNVKLSPDHRVPRSRGGTNDDSNWQPLCEQCNNAKSSACQGCSLNCQVCFWAYPETYKPIIIEDDNREQIRRAAEKAKADQSAFVNKVLREHFLGYPSSG